MKKLILLGIACLLAFCLASCSNDRYSHRTDVRADLTQETWMQRINLNPNRWVSRASRWFYTDEPTESDEYAPGANAASAITTMMVRVPNFTNIQVDGPFRVQIYGHQERNSLYILGPNFAARQVVADIRGDTLYIHLPKDCTKNCANLRSVIVRIGINDLRSLVNHGGYIEGKDIYSSSLNLTASSSADTLLVGNMNIRYLNQAGDGTVTVIGANTPSLVVCVTSNGSVNLHGRINVHQITKSGCGNLNIIGVDSNALDISSSGSGTTAVVGYANLRRLNTSGYSRVYVYWVSSNGIYANVLGNSRVGLAGASKNLDIELGGSARFEGKYLRVQNIYIRTQYKSHANVFPVQKLFASAYDYSSIYFFGSPNVISRYTVGQGAIIPVWCDTCPVLPLPPPSAMTYYSQPVPVVRRTYYK